MPAPPVSKSFFDTWHCRSRQHCNACRTDQNFRRYIADRYVVPGENFDCVYGVTASTSARLKVFAQRSDAPRKTCGPSLGLVSWIFALFTRWTSAARSNYKSRIEICMSCEHIEKRSGRCKLCGCFVRAKAMLNGQACPIGKW